MEPTFLDLPKNAALLALGAVIIVAVVSWVLHYVIALTSPPDRRARLTAGLAYLVAAAVLTLPTFGGDTSISLLGWFAPVLALPAGLLCYLFWRHDFSKDWLDDADGIPDGVELANDDWRIGLLVIAGIAVILFVRAAFRLSLAH